MTTRHTTMSAGMLVLLMMLAVAVTAWAGTSFRLEIGPPVAGGTGFKLKDAVLVTRAILCDDLAALQVTGTAEGMVNGTRQSVPLRLIPAGTPGVYAVTHQWPAQGQWVLHLAGRCTAPKADASTIVPLRKSAFIREKTQVLREPATRAQIEAALADLVHTES